MRKIVDGKLSFPNPLKIKPIVSESTKLVTGVQLVLDVPVLPSENVAALLRILPSMWKPGYEVAEFTDPETPMGFLRELFQFAGNPIARKVADRLRVHISLMQRSPEVAAQSPIHKFAPTNEQIAELTRRARERSQLP